MFVYAWLFATFLGVSLIELSNCNSKYNKLIFMILGVIIIIISSIRWQTGTDWWPYYFLRQTIHLMILQMIVYIDLNLVMLC